ncbi:unnamed protein product (macronuclear) [Paramecium tetraurelia]|uniref:VWFA domain-containing protein n=1 Tax=Paramecium tetraurelia TaxID=5888 RepID=A0C3R8_PARTE|nr:uncharacterized protein GSPATT00034914001 [Paramecium tetraurelia]CAK65435.1 unnamed protein product [Paramecium tetraurelia]|eukprot:XP_001432832.1 hypothetical protein (macronuclear) [Paramecium tetraurelia strain d4-2]
MDNLEIKIDELNQCFFKYGAILGDIGQGLLYNFAIFVIWRIQCYQKYLEYKKQEQNLSVLKKRYLIIIIFKLKIIANEIINQSIRQNSVKFQIDARQELNQSVKDPKMQSCSLIDELDNKLFNKNQKQYSFDQTLHYINNPVNLIANEVNERTNKIREQFAKQYNQKLQETQMSYLNLLHQKLQNLSEKVTINSQAIEFFIQLDNPEDAPKMLYQIMMGYLRGTLAQGQLNNIQDKFKNIFSNPDDTCKISKELSDQKYQKIYLLSDFISGFINTIQEQIKSIQNLRIEIELFELQIQKIRSNLIGCRQCCPTCKRKCDQDNVDGHSHRCRNGHLLRVMAGILINNMPSLYQCEEIKQHYLVKEFNQESTNNMSQLKEIYQDWAFDDNINEQTKEKFTTFWKNNGKEFCQYRFSREGKEFKFVENQVEIQAAQQPSFHYIILLDDSGSMSGDRFNQAQNGLISSLSSAKDNQNIRVTIIIFNDNARCVVDSQTINMQTIKNAVVCNGGGTSFQSAFQLAYQKIAAVKNFEQFNKHVIFFYTDGGDSYPTQALNQFANLPQAQRMKIDLIACCLDKQQKTMINITDFFNKNCSFGKLQDQMEPSQIGEAWRNQTRQIIV